MSGRADRGTSRRPPVFWFLSSALSCFALFVVWLWGAWSGGLDVAETCRLLHGQPFDPDYRGEHLDEPLRVFPLHNKCNASYDLVPAWINPTLVCLAVTATGCFVSGTVAVVARFRARVGWARRRPEPEVEM
ncbi:hypothetical protein SUDANB176_04777 [Streptomyces sp. enrichment culture]|uniref:hypothetical protein n=1 Tax=Streptomyces sp. enrichment culture TaxID=1795815 RepID=UPI003F54664E